MDNVERERLAKLEVLVSHMGEKIDAMEVKVSAMHDILQQIKGAKWFGWTIAAFLGFLLSKAEFMLTYFSQGRP